MYRRALLIFIWIIAAFASKAQVQMLTHDTTICRGSTLNLRTQLTTSYDSVLVGAPDDEYTIVVDLGFTFNYFGNNYTQCVLSTNGYLSFKLTYATQFSPFVPITLPSASAPLNSVFLAWYDIYPPAGASNSLFSYSRYGTAPHRKFIYNMCKVPLYSCTSILFSGQIILYEDSNKIELHITNKQNCTTSQKAVQGMQNAAGSAASTSPSRNNTVWSAANDAYKFIPTSSTTYSVSSITYSPIRILSEPIKWYGNNNYVGSGYSISVTPQVSTKYVAQSIHCDTLGTKDSVMVWVDNFPFEFSKRSECRNKSDGQAIAKPLNGAPFKYVWKTTSGTIIRNTGYKTTADTIPNLSFGSYTLTIKDSIGCDSTLSFSISKRGRFTISPSDVDCSLNRRGLSIITPLDTEGYNIVWKTSAGSILRSKSNLHSKDTLPNLMEGNYIAYITYPDNLCDTSFAFSINKQNKITYTFTYNNISCIANTRGSALLIANNTNLQRYIWKDATNNIIRSSGWKSSNDTLINILQGNYSLTIQNDAGCDSTFTFQISKTNLLSFNFSVTPVSCANNTRGMAILQPNNSKPQQYTWKNNATNTVIRSTGWKSTADTLANLYEGSYSLNIANDAGCDTTFDFQIVKSDPLTFAFTKTNVSCANNTRGNAILFANNTRLQKYTWKNGSGIPIQTTSWISTNDTLKDLFEGNYSITIQNDAGCDSTFGFQITKADLLTFTFTKTNVSCSNNTRGVAVITANNSRRQQYVWKNGSGIIIRATGWIATNDTLKDLFQGSYSVSILNDAGCDSTINFQIIKADPITFGFTTTDVSCLNNTRGIAIVTANNSRPQQYTWKNSAGIVIHSSGWTNSNDTLKDLFDGTYSLNIQNDAGCDSTFNFIIHKIGNPTFGFIKTDISCNAGNMGKAVFVTNNARIQQFVWNNASGTVIRSSGWKFGSDSLINLTPGGYSLYVLNDAGCDTFFTFTIQKSSTIPLQLNVLPVFCDSSSRGIAIATISNGYAHTYTWKNAAGTVIRRTISRLGADTLDNLALGNYSVLIQNPNTCDTTINFTIIKVNKIPFTTTITDVNCASGNRASFILKPTWVDAHNYTWKDSTNTIIRYTDYRQGADTIGNLKRGTYSVNMSNQVGCDTTLFFTIRNNNSIPFNLQITHANCAAGNHGMAVFTALNAASHSYIWMDSASGNVRKTASNIVGSDTIKSLLEGSYKVYVQNTAGCDTMIYFRIRKINSIPFALTITKVNCATGSEGFAIIKVLNNALHNVIWMDSASSNILHTHNNFSVSDTLPTLLQGSYKLLLSNNIGCDTLLYFRVIKEKSIPFTLKTTAVNCATGALGYAVFGALNTAQHNALWMDSATSTTLQSTNYFKGNDTLKALLEGSYKVLISNEVGCDTLLYFKIAKEKSIPFSLKLTQVNCATGAYGYAIFKAQNTALHSTIWMDSATGNIIHTANNLSDADTAKNLLEGAYKVLVSNKVGCDTLLYFHIVKEKFIPFQIALTQVNCATGAYGYAQFMANNTALHNTIWMDSATSKVLHSANNIANIDTAKNLLEGNYKILISNNVGCDTLVYFHLVKEKSIPFDLRITQVNCATGAPGFAIFKALNTALHNTIWMDSATGNVLHTANNINSGDTVKGLLEGHYKVLVSNQVGCDTILYFHIVKENTIPLNIDITPVNCATGAHGYAVFKALNSALHNTIWMDSASGNVRHTASNISNTDTVKLLLEGSYKVLVSNLVGCDTLIYFRMVKERSIPFNVSPVNISCAAAARGYAIITAINNTPHTIIVTDSASGIVVHTATNITIADTIKNLLLSTYKIYFSNAVGCDTFTYFRIRKSLTIPLIVNTKRVSCRNGNDGQVIIQTLNSGRYQYQWFSNTNVLLRTTSNRPQADTLSGLVSGRYKVHITDELTFCDTSFNFYIDTNYYQVDFTFNTLYLCGSYGFTNTSVGRFVKYEWDFGDGNTSTDINPTHLYLNDGTYTILLKASSNLGCIDTVSKTTVVHVMPGYQLLADDTAVCNGTPIAFNSPLHPLIDSSEWNFGDGTKDRRVQVTHTYSKPGDYKVGLKAYTHYCKDTIRYFNIHVYKFPYFKLRNDTTICSPNELVISDNQNDALTTHQWNTGETGASITINKTGVYICTATRNECNYTDTIVIHKACPEYLPNAFSPNKDGINDRFLFTWQLPYDLEGDYTLRIYNRWGQLIYETHDPSVDGWDGMSNGEAVPEGMYIYTLDALFYDVRMKHFKGTIQVIR